MNLVQDVYLSFNSFSWTPPALTTLSLRRGEFKPWNKFYEIVVYFIIITHFIVNFIINVL